MGELWRGTDLRVQDRPVLLTGEIRRAVGALLLFSVLTNVLGLTGVAFMLQVYDRVLAGRSLETLIVLFAIAAGLYVVQGALITIRCRVADRIGQHILVGHEAAMLKETAERLSRGARMRGRSPIQDLDAFARAIRGRGLNAVLDIPWSVIFLCTLWTIAPLMGFCALFAATLLIVVMLGTSWLRPKPIQDDSDLVRWTREFAVKDFRTSAATARKAFSENVARARRVARDRDRNMRESSDNAMGLTGALRQIGQSAVLGAGAWLVIDGQATIGIMMASGVLVGRIFGPIEALLRERQVIGSGIGAWRRLKDLQPVALRAPVLLDRVLLEGPLRAQRLGVASTPQSERTLSNVSFSVEPGQLLVVTGDAGSGKSLLLRSIAGSQPLAQGILRLGDAQYGLIEPELMERLVGFLPQENVFLPGTIAEAIARHDPAVQLIEIIQAAKRANVHELITSLREAYQTRLYPDGMPLPFTFSRRLGLARAICHRPRLLVLDDPLAGLDHAGVKLIAELIKEHRAEGGMCVVAANPPAFLDTADNVLLLGDGRVAAYGLPAEVFKPRPTKAAKRSEKAGGDHAS